MKDIKAENFTLDFFINNEKKSFQANEDYSLTWLIAFTQVSTLQIPAAQEIQAPLWVLVNGNFVVNADKISFVMFQNASIITIQYALHIPYFRMIYEVLRDFGVLLTIENTALLVFTVHTWLQSELVDVDTKIFFLMKHYPSYITQPITIKNSYLHIQKNIEEFKQAFNEYQNKQGKNG